MRLRTREEPFPLSTYLGCVIFHWYGTDYVQDQYDRTYYAGFEPKVSEEICWDELHPGPPYRSGGPFDLWSYKTDSDDIGSSALITINANWRAEIEGFTPLRSLTSYLSHSTLADYRASNADDISSYGPTGWNKFRPTKSSADLGQFLGEFKDVPRTLMTTARAFRDAWRAMGGSLTGFGPKSVANHWLNTQFGWIPFLNDLRKFYDTTCNFQKQLDQLRRDNGQWVKRGGTITTDEDTQVVEDQVGLAGLHPILPTGFYSGTPYGSTHVTLTESQRVWFVARFRYWIPDIQGPEWSPRAVAHIFGAMPSPSLVWELTPWSWLVDWASNVGDNLANMSSILYDNLTAKYAYVMGTTSYKVEYTGCSNFITGPIERTWTAEMIRKQRCVASPFGFGLTGVDFSARQWSILSALGLTRLGR